MTFIIKETKTNRFYSADARDRDELTPEMRQAQELSYAQAEALCETLNKLYGNKYRFELLQANSLLIYQ